MSIPVTDIHVARITIRAVLAAGGSSAKNIANVFHYRRVATAVAPSKAALRTIFDTTVAQIWLDAANADITAVTIGVRWLDDADDAEVVAVATPNTVGQIAGERLPSINAVSMLMRSSLRNRHFRGRKSFAGLSEADTVDDIISGAAVARWQDLRDGVLAPITDSTPNTWNPCVYSRSLSIEEINPTTILTEDVTQVLMNLNVGTMRRRRVATIR